MAHRPHNRMSPVLSSSQLQTHIPKPPTPQTAAVELLLASGASIDQQAEGGSTALHCAAAGGHVEVLKLLLQRGAGRETLNSIGGRALHCAVSSNNYHTVEALLDRWAERWQNSGRKRCARNGKRVRESIRTSDSVTLPGANSGG